MSDEMTSDEIAIARGKSYTVDRGGTRNGSGMLRGLGVVFGHFVQSYGARSNKKSDIDGTFTVEYPEQRLPLPEAYRNLPVLLYDDASGHELCTSCFQCERICPPQVIHMTQAKDPLTGKALPAVTDFVIEYDACMSCGLCAEVCPFDAIKMDHAFELSTAEHATLTLHKDALNRPVSYYASIAPTAWAEARDGALKKLEGAKKRRSGTIGLATTPANASAETGLVAPAAEAPVVPVAEAAAPLPPQAEQQAVPAPAVASADEKQARLAAIRAAKAAARAAEEPPVE